MSFRTLEDKIQTIGNPVEMLRNASAGPYQFPIKAEFTNWRDEQKAWRYATCPYDLVSKDSKAVGLSHYPVYTSNVGEWISLALLDEGVAEPGTDVSLTWGESDGGTKKPTVERHVQTEIACMVELCSILRSGKKEPVAKT